MIKEGKLAGDLLLQLVKITAGEVDHLWEGDCPDSENNFKSRDPECPACRVLVAAANAITGEMPYVKQKPTIEGGYWVRCDGDKPLLVSIQRDEKGELYVYEPGTAERHWLEEYIPQCEWSGPLQPPSPQSGSTCLDAGARKAAC